MRDSLYWDDFQRRAIETSSAIKLGKKPPVRRVAVFITDKCNFRCGYCNHKVSTSTLSEKSFHDVVEKYGDTAIIHITGGEPSTVKWLYPFLKKYGNKCQFHLNTNAYITPPYKFIKRLKISLDHYESGHWDCLVGRSGAFVRVVDNIKRSIPHTTVSITYALSKENYRESIDFARFSNREFVGLYAIFFSVYKGNNPAYMMDEKDAEDFFINILPKLERELPSESFALIRETIDEKRRLIQGIRFSQDINKPCYLSMSEIVIDPDGREYTCSHLYRDNIYMTIPHKHQNCLYGCNQRLVRFNEEVEALLK